LNGSAYVNETTFTIAGATSYTFLLYNANHYVNNGAQYCSGNELRQPTINDCGTTSYTVVESCSCSCNQDCAGSYTTAQYCSGNSLLQNEYYYCNNALKQVNTISSCSCSCNVGCNGTYWGSNYCDGNALKRAQYYYCNGAPTGTVETLDGCSCSCNAGCAGTYIGSNYCSGNALVHNVYNNCDGSYVRTDTVDACSCSCNAGCAGTYVYEYCSDTNRMGVLRYYCNNANAGDPYVIEYNSTLCANYYTLHVPSIPNEDCTLVASFLAYSYEVYSEGWYNFDGTLYYITSGAPNNDYLFYSATPSSCTPAPSFLYYEIQLCSGGSTYIMSPTDVTPIIGRSYKVYAPAFLGTMNGINCWTVVAGWNTGAEDTAEFGTRYIDCTSCNNS
jgi:hypothetical protein